VHDLFEEQFGLPAKRLAEVVVEIGKQPRIRRDGIEVAQV